MEKLTKEQKRLLKEAKKRGFVKGVEYVNTIGDYRVAKEDPYWYSEAGEGIALGPGDGLIYDTHCDCWGGSCWPRVNLLGSPIWP